MRKLTVFVVKLFCSPTKGVLLNCILILGPKSFMLGKKAQYNATSLELYTTFHFQLIIIIIAFAFLILMY